MSTIGSRQLRETLADVLARVEAGEVVEVSRSGRIVAVLAPAALWTRLLRLEAGAIPDEPDPFALDADLFPGGVVPGVKHE